jgi:hypothetical protein
VIKEKLMISPIKKAPMDFHRGFLQSEVSLKRSYWLVGNYRLSDSYFFTEVNVLDGVEQGYAIGHRLLESFAPRD